MQTKIYLIRHSIPERNIDYDSVSEDFQIFDKKRVLSAEGELMAQKYSHIDELNNIDVAISSDYARTMATIKYVAKNNNIAIKINSGFGERNFGVKNRDDIPDDYWDMQENNHNFKLSGGESFNETQERMYQSLMEVIEKYRGKRIAIASHGSSMEMLFDKWCDVVIENEYKNVYYKGKLVYVDNLETPDLFELLFEDDELKSITRISIN